MSEVRCHRCNKVLTNPKSISRGFGPVCWKHIHEGTAKPYAKNLVETFSSQTAVSTPQKETMKEKEIKT